MTEKPMPRIDALSRPFWEGCNNSRLMIQRCIDADCGRFVFYPRVCCPHCHGDTLKWHEATGKGEVISYTTVFRTHHESFDADAPYLFAAVRLKEGPILYAQLEHELDSANSLVGLPVVAQFHEHGPRQKIIRFIPDSDGI